MSVCVLIAIAGCGRVGFDALGEQPCVGVDCADARRGDAGNDHDAAGSLDGAPTGDGAIAPDGALTGDGGMLGDFDTITVADTALNSFEPDWNYGAGEVMNIRSGNVSTFVGLIRFDPSGAPAGTIDTAELRLTTTVTALSQGQVAIYPILESWTEGTQIGGTGTASWNERLDGTAWTAAGCGEGSRSSTAVATFAPLETDTVYTIALPPALVEGWRDMPASNLGLALVAEGVSESDAVGFWTREHGSDAPRLVLHLAP